MFRCGGCRKLSEPGERAVTVVVEKRPRTYHYFEDPETQALRDRAPRGENWERVETTGWEIVREEKRHAVCALGNG